MSHTTTTITRRFFKLKVKARPVPDRPAPRESGDDTIIAGAKEIPVPPLFQRSFALPVKAPLRSRWWRNWIWVALPVAFAAALWGAAYYSGKNSASAERHSAVSLQAVPRIAPPIAPGINMRPMRLSSGSHSARGDAREMLTNPSAGNPGPHSGRGMGGNAVESQEHDAADYSSAADEALHAKLDGRGKLVLPADISGSCNVGESGIKDLGACLARNGARAE